MTFDLMSGFFHNSIHPTSDTLTAFYTPQGLGERLRMPKGSSGAPVTSQSMMNRATEGFPNMHIYIDDAIVFNRNPATHIVSLRVFFNRLPYRNLKLAPTKARIGSTPIDVLGMTISRHGLRLNPAKVTNVSCQAMLTNLSQLRSFLGGISYYRRFPPDIAKRLRPGPSASETGHSLRLQLLHGAHYRGYSYGPQQLVDCSLP